MGKADLGKLSNKPKHILREMAYIAVSSGGDLDDVTELSIMKRLWRRTVKYSSSNRGNDVRCLLASKCAPPIAN